MQLLHVKFRPFPHAAPQNRTSFMMHFEHMSFRLLTRIAEDPLEDHGHVAHQIYRVVVHHHLPRKIEIFFRTGLFFDGGLINGRWSRIFPNRKRGNRRALSRRHLLPTWLCAHIQKANIRRLQFKPAFQRRAISKSPRRLENCRSLIAAGDSRRYVASRRIRSCMLSILRASACFRSSKPCKCKRPCTMHNRSSPASEFPKARACRRAVSTLIKISPC